MSDEKKHSAEYAAKMVLKKAYEVFKAHEAKSAVNTEVVGQESTPEETQSLDSKITQEGEAIETMSKSEKLQSFVNKIAEKRSQKEDKNG